MSFNFRSTYFSKLKNGVANFSITPSSTQNTLPFSNQMRRDKNDRAIRSVHYQFLFSNRSIDNLSTGAEAKPFTQFKYLFTTLTRHYMDELLSPHPIYHEH